MVNSSPFFDILALTMRAFTSGRPWGSSHPRAPAGSIIHEENAASGRLIRIHDVNAATPAFCYKTHMKLRLLSFTLLSNCALGLLLIPVQSPAQPNPNFLDHDRTRPQPAVITGATPSTQEQAGKAPSDATVLFDGKDLSQWLALDGSPTKWITRDGYMECVRGSGYVRTLQNFGDCQLHVEWATPARVEGEGQGRGNSGLFFGLDRYEVQVLDSYGNKTYSDGSAGAIYGPYLPLANACLPPGQWQTYDFV